MSEIKRRLVPCLRGLDPGLRRRRLIAARSYAAHSAPRIAILFGHWDAGFVVGGAGMNAKNDS